MDHRHADGHHKQERQDPQSNLHQRNERQGMTMEGPILVLPPQEAGKNGDGVCSELFNC